MRIGSIIIFYLSKLWKAKFSKLCDGIFWWGCRGNLVLITLGSEAVAIVPFLFLVELFDHEFAMVWSRDEVELAKKLVHILKWNTFWEISGQRKKTITKIKEYTGYKEKENNKISKRRYVSQIIERHCSSDWNVCLSSTSKGPGNRLAHSRSRSFTNLGTR